MAGEIASLPIYAPTSLDEACDLLGRWGDEARPIAGGTALVLMLRQGLIRPQALVRLDGVPGLEGVSLEDGDLRIGATTTLRAASDSALLRAHAPVLASACALVGNVRVRNAATLGGNVCDADYASDPPGILVALDARARVRGPGSTRVVSVADLIRGFYELDLVSGELVTDILVPVPSPGTVAVYLKYLTRSSEDRPCVGATAVLRLGDDGRIADLRVAVGAVAETPVRYPEIEALAGGAQPSEDLFAEVGSRYARDTSPLGDVRGSGDYRKRMIAVFVRRALLRAWQGQSGAWKC